MFNLFATNKAIKEKILKESIASINCPQELSNTHLDHLAASYLKEYPTKNMRHSQQGVALIIQNYAQEHSDLSAEDAWDYLFEIYKKLPNNNGTLARMIRDLFKKAFQEEILLGGDIENSFRLHNTATVAYFMRCKKENYYRFLDYQKP